MDSRKLEVRYLALSWFGYLAFSLGLLMRFVAVETRAHGWFKFLIYVGSALLIVIALSALYPFVTAITCKVIISIDATGFKDARLASAVIPWSAIRSVSSFMTSRQSVPWLRLEIDPNLKRTLKVTRGARVGDWLWLNLNTPVIVLGAVGLDVEADEIARIANTFLAENPA
ncbi:hypothetical protein GWG65_39755 [Bradyrhizobium sp. CSA207]|uniref:hypothetical protein n=1 Tax=Bradyrhizobium sp. CSA207 TaxID=2698826 RepID=UPI0023B1FE16|nr:hypothetical protein [Bradyrhizobium sp. CSA207]MDE5447330.1 hypothetical protein [Bradyrhizobium sp. CSA207]